MSDITQEQPLISVIMPAYNAEKYIEAAVQSVRSQTYTNWELLILDDCSTDDTAKIAGTFAEMDSRICLLRNSQNVGVARTRNRGIEVAAGQWVAFLDSDDVWHKEKLEKQLAVVSCTDADIVYCSYSLMNENAGHLSDFIVPETTSYNDMLKESVLSCSTVLMRRSILMQHRFSAAYYHEDYALWLELLRSGYRAAASRQVLADYRVVKGSRSNDKLRSARNSWTIYRKVEKLSWQKSVNAFAAYAFHGLVKHGNL